MSKSDRIWALIPAAGESRRFRDAGFRRPKPLLRIRHPELGDRTMLGYALDAVPSELLRLVALPTSISNEDYDSRVRYEDCTRIFIEKTEGQGHTIAQMCAWFPREQPVLIVNCDVVFREIDLWGILSRLRADGPGGGGYDAVIACRRSDDPALSYIDHFPIPTRFYEKEVQSSHMAMSGAWAFSSSVELIRAYELARRKERGEVYLSHMMNHYRGTRVALELPAPVDFGTPEAVRACGAEVVG